MIYITHRSHVPEDHPKDAACVSPAVCDICRMDEPHDCFANVWFCKRCTRPFMFGFLIGGAVRSHADKP